MKKPKIKEYLISDTVIYRKQGWDRKTLEEFQNAYIELIESFSAETTGFYKPFTEKQLDKYFEKKL